MLKTTLNAYIRGIASSVPNNMIDNSYFYDKFGAKSVEKISRMTGVSNRYIALEGQCTSDLCYSSALYLMQELSWAPHTVDGIIFVSQTPDYVIPATSCILQNKLGLRNDTFAFDVNLGCSGYVYGLWLAFSLISPTTKRILLLAGDTISKLISPDDRSTSLLFGDGGSATAIEYNSKENRTVFSLNTDGSNFKAIITPAGAFRNRNIKDFSRKKGEDGINRSAFDLIMDGTEIFNFTISKVPNAIKNLLIEAQVNIEEIDYFVPHQANLFILDYIVKKLDLLPEKLVTSIKDYGNTSSASIPISISYQLGPINSSQVLLAGFGVGLSWGIGLLNFKDVYCFPVKKI